MDDHIHMVTEGDMDSVSPAGPFLRVFGGISIEDDGQPVSIGGLRQRRLLALMAIRANQVVTIDWLAEHLWQDDDRPDAAAPALRTYLSRLRQALPETAREWVETEHGGYRLSAPDSALEHLRFLELRKEARHARERGDPTTAERLLDEALAMWRGEPFRELEDVEWAHAEVERLHLDRLEMLEERWEAALALGRHTQIMGELASFTAEHRLRERATRQYALALHRSGRTTEALRVIEDHRRLLADESGLEPSAAVRNLEVALLDGDPSLNVEMEGRPLRGYQLLEEIGSGAFSVVWRGIQPSVQREVAIKQIRAELASQPEFIRRFEAEAHLIARIEHPHIVPLIDYWRDPDSAYLVMRWLRGGTLERRLDDGPLSADETLVIARQVGEALATAHAHGVIHRDVKTANILFDDLGHAFLTDFGIALSVAESSGSEAAMSPGSPAYAAPEQIRRERLGPEADVFSLGVVIFECLTGFLPFADSASADELVERQLQTPFPALDELRTDVPRAVAEAVAKATEKNPADRFDSIRSFLNALETGVEEPATSGQSTESLPRDTTNPYKGLRPFEDVDTGSFFGRERLVAEMVDILGGTGVPARCLVVVGPSGSGKSSVVKAGLIPALRAGAVAGSQEWFSTTMVPGSDPFESLEAALLRIAVNPPTSLLGQLRDGNRGILRSVRRCLRTDTDRVVLVIDQFEELFFGQASEAADDFLEALSTAVGEPTSPLRLVVTLRADYYHRPLEHPRFATILKESAIDVTPLVADELERAIVEPARSIGVDFDPGLVARIAAETTGQPSPLPLLQHTLSELFDRRVDHRMRVEQYDDLGGLSGALSARAEAIYAAADASQRAAIRRAFGQMTDPTGDSADLRRRVPIADLGEDPAVGWVLENFSASRLVSFDHDVTTREPIVEVAHEALLREWPRLATWLDEDRDLLRAVDAVAAAATIWDQGGRTATDLYRGGRLENAVDLRLAVADRLRPIDTAFIEASAAAATGDRQTEQRRLANLRRLVIGVAAALVVAVIAGSIALLQRNQAQDAIAQADLATVISRSAATADDDPEVSVLLALEAHRRTPGPETEQAVLNALGSSKISSQLASFDRLFDPNDSCLDVSFIASDGLNDFATVDGRLVSRDLISGQTADRGAPPTPCAIWLEDEQAGLRWASAEDGLHHWFGTYDGPWSVAKEFGEPTDLAKSQFTTANRAIFVDRSGMLLLLDGSTGEPVGAPFGDGNFMTVDSSLADTRIAASFAVNGAPEGNGLLIVIDDETGEEVFRVTTALPAQALVFDDTTGELIAGMAGGAVMTIDLGTGRVISEVETTTRSSFLDIGVQSDGLIVAVSAGQIELIERFVGPVSTTEIRNAVSARIRPDGSVLTITGDERIEVFDLDANALVEHSYSIDPFGNVGFNAGLVAVVRLPDGDPEVIDLVTGTRTTLPLVTPDGQRFTATITYPEPDGLWALESTQGVIARWESGNMVELVDLGGQPFIGNRFGDFFAAVILQPDGTLAVTTVGLKRGGSRSMSVIPAPDARNAHPTPDGGVHIIDTQGTLRTYDSAGFLISEVATTWQDVHTMALDKLSGRIALASEGIAAGTDGVLLVDPATGATERLPGFTAIGNLGFARDGEFLVVTGRDGTVRLWDVARQAPVGLVWNGSGAVAGSAAWYDAATDSVWVTSSGNLLQVPLDPEVWIERACAIVGRDLTQDEWDRYVPGSGPLQSACS